MTWNGNKEQLESLKIRWEIAEYTRGRVIDIGPGPWKTYPHFISVDQYRPIAGMQWRPDIVSEYDDLSVIATQGVDAVFSSYCLNRVKNIEATLIEWWRVVKNFGYLILYLPHKNLYPAAGSEDAPEDHINDFLPKDIISVMKNNFSDWDLIRSDTYSKQDHTGFFLVFRKNCYLEAPDYTYNRSNPDKTCAIIRYGGFGDMLQATQLLPRLKKEGYHITLYTYESGKDLLAEEPLIDKFVIHDRDQIPQGALPGYWEHLSTKYDKFINLSESVEGTFLAIEGRPSWYWSTELRHSMMNKNYTEFMYKLAGFDCDDKNLPDAPRFFETDYEMSFAQEFIDSIDGLVIMWVLSGSSMHKVWPYTDSVIAHYMIHYDNINFVLVGDDQCRILEFGWQEEPRVLCQSGKLSVRQTIAIARKCSLVIGPETGILNAVSGDAVPKIIMLSHSSVNNLTKYWTKTTALHPNRALCECYPCHKMLHSLEKCNPVLTEMHDGTAPAAKCKTLIQPPEVIKHIDKYIGVKKK